MYYILGFLFFEFNLIILINLMIFTFPDLFLDIYVFKKNQKKLYDSLKKEIKD